MKYDLESIRNYFSTYNILEQENYIILGIFFAVIFILIYLYLQSRKFKFNKIKSKQTTLALLDAEKKLKVLNGLLEKKRIDYSTYKSKVAEIASKLDLDI